MENFNLEDFIKGVKDSAEATNTSIGKLLNLCIAIADEVKDDKTLISNLNEQVKAVNMQMKVQREKRQELEKQVQEIKESIILSTENANRSGRPSLTDEDINFIRELRKQGLSQRAVAERVGVANGTVAKYDKMLENNINEQSLENKNPKTEMNLF